MKIELFDAQAGFGGSKAGQRRQPGVEDWLAEMRRLGIERALVRLAPGDLEADTVTSNDLLFEACRSNSSLLPCPVLVACETADIPSEEEQVRRIVKHGGGAAWLRPAQDYWSLAPWCSDRLFRSLCDRRMPAFCLEGEISLENVAIIAQRYPELPIIAAGIGYRSLRILIPLLKSFKNVSASIGNPMAIHRGIEHLVGEVGAERLLFGTGFPESDAGPAVTMLLYAEISDKQKAMIGSVNLQQLIEGIRR